MNLTRQLTHSTILPEAFPLVNAHPFAIYPQKFALSMEPDIPDRGENSEHENEIGSDPFPGAFLAFSHATGSQYEKQEKNDSTVEQMKKEAQGPCLGKYLGPSIFEPQEEKAKPHSDQAFGKKRRNFMQIHKNLGIKTRS